MPTQGCWGSGLGIGTPAALWTLVGIYGTAATGIAIGALSGAAAGAATAAWIGRAATLGMGGMTAGRIALGPIGVAASLLTLPTGAAIAGNRERNYIRKANEAAGKMARLERILERCRNRMMPLQPRIAVAAADMHRHTGPLETATPGTPVRWKRQHPAHRKPKTRPASWTSTCGRPRFYGTNWPK